MIGELRSIHAMIGKERKTAIIEMVKSGNYKLDEASIEMVRDMCRPRQKYTSEARNDLSLEDIEAMDADQGDRHGQEGTERSQVNRQERA